MPVLHETFDETVVRELENEAPVVHDGALKSFARGRDTLCFAQVSARPSRTDEGPSELVYLENSSWVRWYPGSDAQAGLNRLQQSHAVHMALAAEGSNRWYFAGGCTMSAESAGHSAPRVDFFLTDRLPRRLWLLFGGFENVFVRVGTHVYEDDSVQSLLGHIEGEWSVEQDVEIRKREDESLSAMLGRDGEATLFFHRSADEVSLVSRGDKPKSEGKFKTFLKDGAWEYEAPASSVIPRRAAIEILRAYVESGETGELEPAS